MSDTVESALVFDYLLGSPTAGPGLIRRAELCISSMDQGWKPVFRTGSWIGTGDVSHDSKDEDGRVDELFRLGIALSGWLADKEPLPGAVKNFASYLARNQVSDIDWTRNRLKEVRHAVGHLRSSVLESDLLRVQHLAAILKGFMGTCEHIFSEIPTDLRGVAVFRCDCGASYKMYDGHQEWFAV